jgi:hypothetical protein
VENTVPTAELRKANIGDAMILMVALGVGLALCRTPWSQISQWFSLITPTLGPVGTAWTTEIARRQGMRYLVIQGCVALFCCFLVPLTPALLVARLRWPRPPLRNLAFQPGFVASVALCLTAIIIGDTDLTFFELAELPPLIGMLLPGSAVLVSWLILIAARRWHTEASWIDRSGRLVGAFWLATIPWSIWLAP